MCFGANQFSSKWLFKNDVFPWRIFSLVHSSNFHKYKIVQMLGRVIRENSPKHVILKYLRHDLDGLEIWISASHLREKVSNTRGWMPTHVPVLYLYLEMWLFLSTGFRQV